MGKFEIKADKYYLNDQKFNIHSGAIHYFRTVPEYWRDRLTKLKACGLNTVETYVPWNWHEQVPNEFDFDGILDIVKFVEIATELGLYVLVRPGPYICAEWEFGGLPAWLLKDPNMRIRCMYQPYLDAVERFYKKLLPMLVPYQITNGGNIIAMQIENEYGSYSNDREYLLWIEKLMRDCGVDVMLFTSDGQEDWWLSGGTLPHIHKTINFGSNPKGNLQKVKNFDSAVEPFTCMEFWCGWFDWWGNKKHITRPAASVASDISTFLEMDANFNFYMFHGGTNFGHWAGANYHAHYAPTTTSYDYDALLTEWGDYTPKYHAVRDVLLAKMPQEKKDALPALPPAKKLQAIKDVHLKKQASLLSHLPALSSYQGEDVTSECMEKYGQNYGYIVYECSVFGQYTNVNLEIDNLADIAFVFVNDNYKGTLVRSKQLLPKTKNSNVSDKSLKIGSLVEGDKIRVVVEGMGRINYGPNILDRKGLSRIRVNNQILTHFKVSTVPFSAFSNIDDKIFSTTTTPAPLTIYSGSFSASQNHDTFLHLPNFTRGMVWINGFNIGRYWNIGPQQTLYVPGTILKDKNQITVLETQGLCHPPLKGLKKLFQIKSNDNLEPVVHFVADHTTTMKK